MCQVGGTFSRMSGVMLNAVKHLGIIAAAFPAAEMLR
jgi:hypothetical protein